ncbi:TlpA disulfide reductase family protein [Flavivirga amylovorans]|uniref:TlpA disulfide reductase family protein n=1 Tax=Flavivirga amylovorans TaxID=870486 RepID=A0ABT8WZF6_9FLAO|nr:TlpA disulfide reductase family protein [Flavivirga amylovorans]MDO5987058.1 TlpA disulfide reductase family protein [Flavivirga amylovorans]
MKIKTKITIASKMAIICLIIITAVSCNKSIKKTEGYVIKGTIKGMDSGSVKLLERKIFDDTRAKVFDSSQIIDGHFQFKGTIEHPDMVILSIDEDNQSFIFLENCDMTLELDVNQKNDFGFVKTKISGSKYNNILKEHNKKADSIANQDKYDKTETLFKEVLKFKEMGDDVAYENALIAFQKLAKQKFKEVNDFKIQFTKDNPALPVSPYVLGTIYGEAYMSNNELKEFYNLFEGEAKHTVMYKYYTRRYNEIFKDLAVGTKAPDFTLTTIDGNTLKLSEMKGKYIYLDFWASWCRPCRAAFPHLKKLYKKYKNDGFEVIAVGTSDNEAKWRNAIVEDKTVWNNVFDEDISGEEDYGAVAKAYKVPFLPTTFLIDSNGIIVGRQLRKDALDAKLKELYGY